MKVLVLTFLALAAASATPPELLNSFSLANNQVNADIYKAYKADAVGNFVVSPLSAEVLLALIHAGAGSKTADELSKALHLPQKRDAIDDIYHKVHPKLNVDEKYTLQSANKIYVKKNYPVKEQFKTTAVDVFGASIQNIDFNQKQATVAEINSWVNENTRHKIQSLVTEDDITPETRAVLLNAIYFKGKWQKAFKKASTKKKPFYLTNKSYVDVDMMAQTDYFRYHRSSSLNAQFIELPYEGDDVTMTIVLPDNKEGLSVIEERIHEVVVEPVYIWQRVNLKLPKNKITTFLDLTSILKKLGIQEAFELGADFQDMLDVKDEPLFISKVVQKALIETDEEGTVATAVTGGFMTTTLFLPPPPPIPINFNVNHPYIFFLKHKDVGVFFIGRYSIPEGKVITLETSPEE